MKKRTRADIAAFITAIIFVVYMLITIACTVWSNFLTDAQTVNPPAVLLTGTYIIAFGSIIIIPLFLFMLIYLTVKAVRSFHEKSYAPFHYAWFPAGVTAASILIFLLLGLLKHI